MTFLDAAAKRRLYAQRSSARSRPATSTSRCVRRWPRYGGDDLLNRQLYADLSIYLADDILVKVDRMSMATSLETRAPFLDADVMELAFSMPGDLKIRSGTRKYILKQALRGLLPVAILRSKEGRLQHPDEELAERRAAAADGRPARRRIGPRARSRRAGRKSRGSSTNT